MNPCLSLSLSISQFHLAYTPCLNQGLWEDGGNVINGPSYTHTHTHFWEEGSNVCDLNKTDRPLTVCFSVVRSRPRALPYWKCVPPREEENRAGREEKSKEMSKNKRVSNGKWQFFSSLYRSLLPRETVVLTVCAAICLRLLNLPLLAEAVKVRAGESSSAKMLPINWVGSPD